MRDDDIRSGMRDLAEQAQPAFGLADIALRRARRRGHLVRAGVAGGSALAVAVGAVGLAYGLPTSNGPGRTITPAKSDTHKVEQREPERKDTCSQLLLGGGSKEIPCPTETDDPTPPKPIDLAPLPERADNVIGLYVNNEAWYLADPESGELKQSKWSWVTASPDGEQLAVLEHERTSRIGIVDRASGKVEQWIDTPKGISRVFWSPEGDRLVATAYRKVGSDPVEPDIRRTGFVIIEPGAGSPSGELVKLPTDPDDGGAYEWDRRAVFWAGDGSGLLTTYGDRENPLYGIRLLDFDGDTVRSIPNVGAMTPADGVATSPDNSYVMTEPNKTKNRIIELDTGSVLERTRSFGSEVWLDNESFIGDLAWTEITAELAVIDVDGTVLDKFWKAPKDVVVSGIAISR